jgi:hypothetical protein
VGDGSDEQPADGVHNNEEVGILAWHSSSNGAASRSILVTIRSPSALWHRFG